MNLKSASYKGNKVKITYEVNNDDSNSFDLFTLTTEEVPQPEFDEALQNLKPHVLTILELPSKYGEGLTVTSVSISQKSSTKFYSITGKKDLQTTNSPFNLTTPLKPDVVDEGDGSTGLSVEAITALQNFEREAKKYAMGQRAQAQLDLG